MHRFSCDMISGLLKNDCIKRRHPSSARRGRLEEGHPREKRISTYVLRVCLAFWGDRLRVRVPPSKCEEVLGTSSLTGIKTCIGDTLRLYP